jgi:hypothetical protein
VDFNNAVKSEKMQKKDLIERKRKLAGEQKRDLDLKNHCYLKSVNTEQEFDKSLSNWMHEDYNRG